MNHLCTRLVEAIHYLEANGMAQHEYSTLHHGSLKGRQVTFALAYRYFKTLRNLKKKNTSFAERCIFVAGEHRIKNAKNFEKLVSAALVKWPMQSS